MSRQIIKQPNGKYAIWSSIINNFVYEDLTSEEYIFIRMQEKFNEIIEEITEITKKLDNGKKPYYQFTITYEEAVKLRDEIHNGQIDEKDIKLEKDTFFKTAVIWFCKNCGKSTYQNLPDDPPIKCPNCSSGL